MIWINHCCNLGPNKTQEIVVLYDNLTKWNQENLSKKKTISLRMQQTFKNKLEIYEYLKAQEWKVAQSTLYKHAKEGRLKPDKKGVYSLKKINKYATLHLERQETRQKIGEEDWQKRKIKAEVARLTEQAKLAHIKRLAEEGRYVLREDVELELAGKAAVLETGLKSMVQTKAGELIDLVEGNEKKTGDLIRVLISELDQAINEFASTQEYHVIFKANENRTP